MSHHIFFSSLVASFVSFVHMVNSLSLSFQFVHTKKLSFALLSHHFHTTRIMKFLNSRAENVCGVYSSRGFNCPHYQDSFDMTCIWKFLFFFSLTLVGYLHFQCYMWQWGLYLFSFIIEINGNKGIQLSIEICINHRENLPWIFESIFTQTI